MSPPPPEGLSLCDGEVGAGMAPGSRYTQGGSEGIWNSRVPIPPFITEPSASHGSVPATQKQAAFKQNSRNMATLFFFFFFSTVYMYVLIEWIFHFSVGGCNFYVDWFCECFLLLEEKIRYGKLETVFSPIILIALCFGLYFLDHRTLQYEFHA